MATTHSHSWLGKQLVGSPISFFLLMELNDKEQLNDKGQIEVKLDRLLLFRKLWIELFKESIINGYTWNQFCFDHKLYQYIDKCRYCGK